MSEWCMEHTWMTFFIAMTLASSLAGLVRVVYVTVRKDR